MDSNRRTDIQTWATYFVKRLFLVVLVLLATLSWLLIAAAIPIDQVIERDLGFPWDVPFDGLSILLVSFVAFTAWPIYKWKSALSVATGPKKHAILWGVILMASTIFAVPFVPIFCGEPWGPGSYHCHGLWVAARHWH